MANSAFSQTFAELPLSIANGGTGAISASAARTNLGLIAGGAGDIWVEKGGDTMTGDLIVPDEVYSSSWNGNLEVPTKNAIYDKIETVVSSSGSFARTFALMGS